MLVRVTISFLRHDLQVLERVVSCLYLRLLGRVPRTVAHRHRHHRQLHQTLVLSGKRLLLHLHVGHLEVLFVRDVAQHLQEIEVVRVQGDFLKTGDRVSTSAK